MAQKTFADGDVLTASDINTYLMGEGGAWTSYTPQIDQGASTDIAKTVTYSKYARHGRMITWNFTLDLTAAGTAGAAVSITLPATAASTQGVVGVGWVYDAAPSTLSYVCSIIGQSTSIAYFLSDGVAGSGWGAAPNLALASGDSLRGSITYEAAS